MITCPRGIEIDGYRNRSILFGCFLLRNIGVINSRDDSPRVGTWCTCVSGILIYFLARIRALAFRDMSSDFALDLDKQKVPALNGDSADGGVKCFKGTSF